MQLRRVACRILKLSMQPCPPVHQHRLGISSSWELRSQGSATTTWHQLKFFSGSALVLRHEPDDPAQGDPRVGTNISVDRSGLQSEKAQDHGKGVVKEEETPMARHLKALIKFRGGPISVAEFMGEVLTNPREGFYMNRDVFGTGGDFITSPDVSQMFGEMIGVWTMCLWEQMGSPPKVRLIELGPGRGTLMADLLRATAKFKEFSSALSVHLVEVSPALRKIQQKTLQCESVTPVASNASVSPLGLLKDTVSPLPAGTLPNPELGEVDLSQLVDQVGRMGALVEQQEGKKLQGQEGLRQQQEEEGVSGISGAPLRWHVKLGQVASGEPTILIAHEFFDALPIHQFQKTDRGWCEKLVDVADDASPQHLRFVLSPGPNAATTFHLAPRLKWATDQEQQAARQVEVSPASTQLAMEIAQRVGTDGGGAIIIDYGETNLISDSLQAISKHEFGDVLSAPGRADLSAYVDFAALSHIVTHADVGATAYGPVSQSQLLGMLGINFRFESLLQNATEEEAEALKVGYWRLVGDGEIPWEQEEVQGEQKGAVVHGMGLRYKALAIVNSKLGTPICFV